MKTLLIALNSKYIHTSLAPWYLKAACGKECGEVLVLEHTVNESINDVLTSIYLNKPDVAAFSCYIWNITHVLKLAASLKKLLPKTLIIFGGPEVSYDADQILKENGFVDFILAGEGDESFPKLIGLIAEKHLTGACGQDQDVFSELCRRDETLPEGSNGKIEGLAWRQDGNVMVQVPAMVNRLDNIPSPYTDEMLSAIKNRIVYFEASRGCPYSCSYCLSSAAAGTRYFSLERVFQELDRLVEAGARQIKFVDRTFNCHRGRALAIIRHITGKYGKTDCNFHFEVGADLFDDEMLQMLACAPKGLFQIEAGIQTVNNAALEAVNRKTDLDRLFSNLKRIHDAGNIHIHADLIAGLPYEDYRSFGNSFNMVYNASPNQLQLGFLKFLKGTALREDAEKRGYSFNSFPPYEILSGKHIGYDELVVLKDIAELVERVYNSGRFEFSLKYIIRNCFHSPFHFFECFASYCRKTGSLNNPAGVRELYAIFDAFASTCKGTEDKTILQELLRLDFLASDPSGTLPDFMEKRSSRNFIDNCFEYLKRPEISVLIPETAGMQPKQIFKKVHFEIFNIKLPVLSLFDGFIGKDQTLTDSVYVFNYLNKDKVIGKYPFFKVDINPFNQ